MPIKREYIKIEKGTGYILEEGFDNIYTIEEVNKKEIKNKKYKTLTEFEELIKDMGSFNFLFYNYLKKLDIIPEIKTRFIFLTTYIRYNGEGILVDTDNERYQTVLTRDLLMDKLKLQKTAFINTINKLKEYNLLVEENGYFKINENIVVKGKLSKQQKNKQYTRLFSDSIKELYNNSTVRQHRQLYYFFALLPIINFKYNCVCYNKKETDLKYIKPMDIKDICNYVGYNQKDWKKFWNNLRYFKIKDQNVISSRVIDDYIFIYINPNLYYAGNENCLSELRIMLHEFYNENIQSMISNKKGTKRDDGFFQKINME